ncbi:MAG: hypothetical protein ABEI96_04010 [Haloarculaceae archaeon]
MDSTRLIAASVVFVVAGLGLYWLHFGAVSKYGGLILTLVGMVLALYASLSASRAS